MIALIQRVSEASVTVDGQEQVPSVKVCWFYLG